MKKIIYIIAGLFVLAGLAFALSNTSLFQGSFPGLSDSTGTDDKNSLNFWGEGPGKTDDGPFAPTDGIMLPDDERPKDRDDDTTTADDQVPDDLDQVDTDGDATVTTDSGESVGDSDSDDVLEVVNLTISDAVYFEEQDALTFDFCMSRDEDDDYQFSVALRDASGTLVMNRIIDTAEENVADCTGSTRLKFEDVSDSYTFTDGELHELTVVLDGAEQIREITTSDNEFTVEIDLRSGDAIPAVSGAVFGTGFDILNIKIDKAEYFESSDAITYDLCMQKDEDDEYTFKATLLSQGGELQSETIKTKEEPIQLCSDGGFTRLKFENISDDYNFTEGRMHNLSVTLDSGDDVEESNEDDNYYILSVDKTVAATATDEPTVDTSEPDGPFEEGSYGQEAYERALALGLSEDVARKVGDIVQSESEGRDASSIEALIENTLQSYVDEAVNEIRSMVEGLMRHAELAQEYEDAILAKVNSSFMSLEYDQVKEWTEMEIRSARGQMEQDELDKKVEEMLREDGRLYEDQYELVLAELTDEEYELLKEGDDDFMAWLDQMIQRNMFDLLVGEVMLGFADQRSMMTQVCIEDGVGRADYPSVDLVLTIDGAKTGGVIATLTQNIDFHVDEDAEAGDCAMVVFDPVEVLDLTEVFYAIVELDVSDLIEGDDTNNSARYTHTKDAAEAYEAKLAEDEYEAVIAFVITLLTGEAESELNLYDGLSESEVEMILSNLSQAMIDTFKSDGAAGLAWLQSQIDELKAKELVDDVTVDTIEIGATDDAATVAADSEASESSAASSEAASEFEAAIAAAEAAAQAAQAAASAAQSAANSAGNSGGGNTYITYEASAPSATTTSSPVADAVDSATSAVVETVTETVTETVNALFPDLAVGTWEEEAILALHEKGIIKGDADGMVRPWDKANRAEVLAMIMRSLYDEKVLDLMNFQFTFEDVSTADWYFNHVHAAVKLGIIDPAPYFNPSTPMTRAEFVSALVRASNKLCAKCTADFADVSTDDWYYRAVATALDAKLVSGFEDGTFRPNDYINRAQIAKVIVEALESGWVGR